jgi:hypothetical protein
VLTEACFKLILSEQLEWAAMQSYLTKVFAAACTALVMQFPAVSHSAEWAIDSKANCKVAPMWKGEGVTVSWEGACKDGIAEGKGKLTWSLNGKAAIVEEGSLRNGILEGKGARRYLLKKSTYRGTFKAGKQHGKGKLDSEEGSDYTGDWVDGAMHGQGRFDFANGNVYEGGIDNGRKVGLGRLTWTDGTYFEGNFIDDYGEGNGICRKGSHTGPCVFEHGVFVKWRD